MFLKIYYKYIVNFALFLDNLTKVIELTKNIDFGQLNYKTLLM